MTNKATYGKDQKYFFTENIFDENHVEQDAPPVFSEQELESARLKSLAEGKSQGLREAESSQLKLTTQILAKIQKQLVDITAAEVSREKIYEQEAVKLCLAVFERLFPFYNEKAGFEELRKSISSILRSQEGQNHVVVTVTPDVKDSIEGHLNNLKDSGLDLKFSVKSDESLPPGACRLAWNEGGALRNPQMLADEISSSLQQVLAKRAPKGHDREETKTDAAPARGPEGDAK